MSTKTTGKGFFSIIYQGYPSGKKEENIKKLEEFCSQIEVVNFDSKCAKITGYIQAEFNKKLTPIGVYRLQIASIAKGFDSIDFLQKSQFGIRNSEFGNNQIRNY